MKFFFLALFFAFSFVGTAVSFAGDDCSSALSADAETEASVVVAKVLAKRFQLNAQGWLTGSSSKAPMHVDSQALQLLARFVAASRALDAVYSGISDAEAIRIFEQAISLSVLGTVDPMGLVQSAAYTCVSLDLMYDAIYQFIEREMTLFSAEKNAEVANSKLFSLSFVALNLAFVEKKQRFHALAQEKLAAIAKQPQATTPQTTVPKAVLAEAELEIQDENTRKEFLLSAPDKARRDYRVLRDLNSADRALYFSVMGQLVARNKNITATHFFNPISGKEEKVDVAYLRKLGDVWKEQTGSLDPLLSVALFFEFKPYQRVRDDLLQAIKTMSGKSAVAAVPLPQPKPKHVAAKTVWPIDGKCIHCKK